MCLLSTLDVFTSLAIISEDILEAMDALCLEVREEPLATFALERGLHPALLHLVGYLNLDSRREYRGLLPGSGSMVSPSGLAYPSRGTFSGEMVTLDMGHGAGAPPDAPGPYV